VKNNDLNERLRAVLYRAWEEGVKIESLASAIGKTTQSVRDYLNQLKGGPLDLEEADRALRHIGSSLSDFLAGQPPREVTDAERLAQELEARPEVVSFVRDLLPLKEPKLSAVLELARGIAHLAIGRHERRRFGPTSGPQRAPRTKSATKLHR
jgi:hypothetical protein